MGNLEDELAKLRELLRAGALTEGEFQQAKATLLEGDVPADCSPGSVTELPTWFAVKYFRYRRGLHRYEQQREELLAKMTGAGRTRNYT